MAELGRAPPSSIVETTGPSEEPRDGSFQMESTLPLSPQPPVPSQVEHANEAVGNPCIVNEEVSPDVGVRQYASPSPTPSEHGSNVSRQQLHASQGTNTATNNDTQPSSSVSSVSSESFPDAR